MLKNYKLALSFSAFVCFPSKQRQSLAVTPSLVENSAWARITWHSSDAVLSIKSLSQGTVLPSAPHLHLCCRNLLTGGGEMCGISALHGHFLLLHRGHQHPLLCLRWEPHIAWSSCRAQQPPESEEPIVLLTPGRSQPRAFGGAALVQWVRDGFVLC